MTARARSVAYAALLDVELKEKYSNIALQQRFRQSQLDERDKALCTEIVYGTLQAERSLDAVIAPLTTRGLASLDAKVLCLLRMSVYQLAFLDRVPSYAVVDDAVQLCKAQSARAAGFVNGVLRAYTRDNRPFEVKLKEQSQSLNLISQVGVELAYPDWFVERMLAQFGRARAEAILKSGNERSTMSVRVNESRVTRAEMWDTLTPEFRAEAALSEVSPLGIRMYRGVDIEQWGAYQAGLVTVQDEASMLVAPLTRPARSQRILDMCAGMGTKTTQILEQAQHPLQVTAVDIHQHKLQSLRTAVTRLCLEKPETVLADARSLAMRPAFHAAYDAVLLDAPCSGSGVLRRRPEIRWRRQPADVESLVELQVELLKTALALTRPGGVVVYATCSLLEAENEGVIRSVVEATNRDCDVELDIIADELPPAVAAQCVTTDHGVYLTPELFGTDGFFMARIRKRD